MNTTEGPKKPNGQPDWDHPANSYLQYQPGTVAHLNDSDVQCTVVVVARYLTTRHKLKFVVETSQGIQIVTEGSKLEWLNK